jgi:hypothetical protein
MFRDLFKKNVWVGFFSFNFAITITISFVLSPVIVRIVEIGRHQLHLDEEASKEEVQIETDRDIESLEPRH